MPQITKPNTLNKIWADGGDRATPLDSKISSGWQIEIPPRQWFNWLDNRQDQAIAHFNQHGIPVWDDQTEYQAGRSYVQDPGNGLIYRCTVTNAGNQPALSPSHWTVAFADAASAFSEGQADLKYLAKGFNLNDLPNKTQARTNLGVYSTTQVDQNIVNALNGYSGRSIGVGQSWVNVTSSRNTGTTYTNSTGRPILVQITSQPTLFNQYAFYVGSVIVARIRHEAPIHTSNVSFIVPPGSTYRTTVNNITNWAELR